MAEPLYIQMFSLHGLIRAQRLELGRDADTGGQVTYVLDLGRHLSTLPGVARVDLFTRLIVDPAVDPDYGEPLAPVTDKFRIVRIQCGGRKYLRKERLWPHLDEFVDKTVKFIRREEAIPDVVHGHYPDAGHVAMELARFFGMPFVYTGHSLGRSKKSKLLASGMTQEEVNRRFKLDRRIAAEEEILEQADLVITSTRQEIREQYRQYHNGQRPDFRVVPPGLDVARFYPFYHDMLPEMERDESAVYARASVMQELNRFLSQPEKPLILALCRPDKRKNISGLIRAFGEDRELQAMANLAIFAGLRKDIEAMEDNEREVLTRMLLLMDKYDLYGKLAIPKKHDFELEVPALYRLTAEKQGVFVNPALTEPFGLTLLEASATGVPIVATNDGGPQEILKNCQNGILVDAARPPEIAGAIKKIIADRERWDKYSKNGVLNVRRHYTWEAHATRYLEEIGRLVPQAEAADLSRAKATDAIGRRLTKLQYLFVTDIDNTLIGEDNRHLADLLAELKAHRPQVGFAVATGRTAASALQHLRAHGIDSVDVVIAAVGSAIYYGTQAAPSRSWATHIASKWERGKIVAALKDLAFLEYQEEETQGRFKVSYFMRPGAAHLEAVHARLMAAKCKYRLIYSHQRYLDILPYRASKGKAIRFLSYKWGIPLRHTAVSGDSGNDEEMLRGEPLGIVVGNYSPELAHLRKSKRVYFAQRACAGGILEGLRKYRFFEMARGATHDA